MIVVALMIALVAIIAPTPLRGDYATLEFNSSPGVYFSAGKDFSLFHQSCDGEPWASTSSMDVTFGPHWAFLKLNPGIGFGVNSVNAVPNIRPHFNADFGFDLPLGPVDWSQYWLLQKDLRDSTDDFGLSRQWLSLTKYPDVGVFLHATWTRTDSIPIQPWIGPYVNLGIGPLGDTKFAVLTNLRDNPGKNFKLFLFVNLI
ncbi:MAG: hypothetical protein NTY61_01575 [Candidatus Parcubacteria bacterium]|nr:hypothetical protein [Candidatus Parcubacteria bacterium]